MRYEVLQEEKKRYDAGNKEIEEELSQIKARLMEARVLDTADVKTDDVQILTRVRVRVRNTGKEKTYQLVTEGEANSLEGKISVTTPIAKGLMGKKVGEIAQVQVPAGLMEYEILEISL